MQPSITNMICCSALLGVSAAVVLQLLAELKMQTAARVFRILVLVVACFVPLYFAQVVLEADAGAAFLDGVPIYLFSKQICTLGFLCDLFGYFSSAVAVLAILAFAALIIAAGQLVSAAVALFKKLPKAFQKQPKPKKGSVTACYIPNYQGTFLKLGHLLN